jgi:hypothetical protein
LPDRSVEDVLRRAVREELSIRWMVYVAEDGTCPVWEYLQELPPRRRNILLARMVATARLGKCTAGPFVRRVEPPGSSGIELMSLVAPADQVLFFRLESLAIAVAAFSAEAQAADGSGSLTRRAWSDAADCARRLDTLQTPNQQPRSRTWPRR